MFPKFRQKICHISFQFLRNFSKISPYFLYIFPSISRIFFTFTFLRKFFVPQSFFKTSPEFQIISLSLLQCFPAQFFQKFSKNNFRLTYDFSQGFVRKTPFSQNSINNFSMISMISKCPKIFLKFLLCYSKISWEIMSIYKF